MLIAYIIKPVDTNIEDNVIIIITMISSLFSILSLFTNYIGAKDFFNSVIKFEHDSIYVTMQNFQKLMDRKDKK